MLETNGFLYNLYKDLVLIGWITFIILTIFKPGDKTSCCTTFGSARVQKLFTIALSIHIDIRVFSVSNSTFGRLLWERG